MQSQTRELYTIWNYSCWVVGRLGTGHLLYLYNVCGDGGFKGKTHLQPTRHHVHVFANKVETYLRIRAVSGFMQNMNGLKSLSLCRYINILVANVVHWRTLLFSSIHTRTYPFSSYLYTRKFHKHYMFWLELKLTYDLLPCDDSAFSLNS